MLEEIAAKQYPECIVRDAEAVLRCIERCSDFPKISSKQKSYEIPDDVKEMF